MIACVQRVRYAEVSVAGEVCGRIERGMLVLLGVAQTDTDADAGALARKLVGLRIFEDDAGKMNRAVSEVGGAMLVVSQFTLLGDCRKGRRPSFTNAASPELAKSLYEAFCRLASAAGVRVARGRFRAEMEVELLNDGPVTLVIDSRDLAAAR